MSFSLEFIVDVITVLFIKFPAIISICFPNIPVDCHSISFVFSILPVSGSFTIIFPFESFNTTRGGLLGSLPIITGINRVSRFIVPVTFILSPFWDNIFAVELAFKVRFLATIFISVLSDLTKLSNVMSPLKSSSTPSPENIL